MTDISSQIIYDGFNFGNNGLVVTDFNHMIIANRDNQIEDLANVDGGVLVQSKFGTKPIPISGYYDGATPLDAQLMYDVLAQVINKQQRPLIVPHAGSTRTFTATPENVVLSEPNGLNRLTFDFEFVVPKGSSTSEEPLVLVDTVITTPSTSIPLTVLGSVAARPVTTLTFTAVSGGTNKTVTLRNARDFIGLSITRDFITGDVITIDSQNYQIYINGVLTEPNGRMPSWAAGSGSMFYSDTFTTRTVSIHSEYLRGDL